MQRILCGESYSSVKSEGEVVHAQQAVTADVPLKSVCDSGIDSILDTEKSGNKTVIVVLVQVMPCVSHRFIMFNWNIVA